MTPQDHWIATPDGRLFARSWTPAGAQAAPLLLWHESLGCVAMWRGFPAALAQATGRRVVAFDRLGYGASDACHAMPAHDFVGADARRQLPPLCEQLGIARFALLGHSVGGGMVVEAAAAFGARCEAVVTLSAQAFVEPLTWQGVHDARASFAQPGQLDRLARHHGDKARWVLDAWTETWLSPGFAGWTLDAALRQVGCPLLAVHGEADPYGSPEHARRIVAALAGPAKLLLLPGCGHAPHLEQPQPVLQAVASLLG